jgi:hypothetical protein
LSLVSFLFLRAKPRRRKEIYAQTALVSWLSALGSRFFLLFARKGAETQRNLCANGSGFLALSSFLFSFFARKDAEAQRNLCANGSFFLALSSWLSFLSSFRSQSREDAKKFMRKRLLFLGSQLLALVSFFFSLAKAQRRKEIYAQTALVSRLLALAT